MRFANLDSVNRISVTADCAAAIAVAAAAVGIGPAPAVRLRQAPAVASRPAAAAVGSRQAPAPGLIPAPAVGLSPAAAVGLIPAPAVGLRQAPVALSPAAAVGSRQAPAAASIPAPAVGLKPAAAFADAVKAGLSPVVGSVPAATVAASDAMARLNLLVATDFGAPPTLTRGLREKEGKDTGHNGNVIPPKDKDNISEVERGQAKSVEEQLGIRQGLLIQTHILIWFSPDETEHGDNDGGTGRVEKGQQACGKDERLRGTTARPPVLRRDGRAFT